jgi:hypothetical protein
MRRHLLGILAIALLIGAGAFYFFPPASAVGIEAKAACWRMGLLLVVWWMAWPQVIRLPRWLLLAVPLLVVVLVLRPRYFLVAIPLVVALALLMPRSASRRSAPRRDGRR